MPERQTNHPLGCHHPRTPERVVFGKLVLEVLVFGCAYRRIAQEGCSATTLRERRDEWIACGAMEILGEIALSSYDRLIGLELSDMAVDSSASPKGPLRRGEGGQEPGGQGQTGHQTCSMAVDGVGIPLGTITAPANRHDSPLLVPTLTRASGSVGGLPQQEASVHLDRGYDSFVTRERLEDWGLNAEVAKKVQPAPLQAAQRWVVERTNSSHNTHKKKLL